MENKELAEQLNKDLALALPEKISLDELKQQLSAHINQLIKNNFEQLVSLLYRIDISESKIKSMLHNNTGENAGDIISSLIIERQLQKLKSREQFKSAGNNNSSEEKW